MTRRERNALRTRLHFQAVRREAAGIAAKVLAWPQATLATAQAAITEILECPTEVINRGVSIDFSGDIDFQSRQLAARILVFRAACWEEQQR